MQRTAASGPEIVIHRASPGSPAARRSNVRGTSRLLLMGVFSVAFLVFLVGLAMLDGVSSHEKKTVSDRGGRMPSFPSSQAPHVTVHKVEETERNSIGGAVHFADDTASHRPTTEAQKHTKPTSTGQPQHNEEHGTPRVAVCRAMHAFYYPWYGSKSTDGKWLHWNHPYLPHWQKEVTDRYPKGQHQPPDDVGASFYPSLGPYSSTANATIEHHLAQMAAAGVGVLVYSWYPLNEADENGLPSDHLLIPIMDRAVKYGIQVAFHSEPYKSRDEKSVRRDFEYIVNTYGKHPSLYRAGPNDLPVIYLYDAYHVQYQNWAKLLGSDSASRADPLNVRGTKYDFLAIALVLKEDELNGYLRQAGFDGGYNYFVSRTFTYAAEWGHWERLAEKARSMGKFWVPSVGPGYNDLQVRPWNQENVKSRQGGRYYDEAMDAAHFAHFGKNKDTAARSDLVLSKESVGQRAHAGRRWPPTWVSITSFNEWHEGTQIEMAFSGRKSVASSFARFTYETYSDVEMGNVVVATEAERDRESNENAWARGTDGSLGHSPPVDVSANFLLKDIARHEDVVAGGLGQLAESGADDGKSASYLFLTRARMSGPNGWCANQ